MWVEVPLSLPFGGFTCMKPSCGWNGATKQPHLLGQSFIRHYMWNYILAGVSAALWQLLEIADHVKEGTYISILWGLVNVVVMSVVQHVVPQFTLVTVAWVYNGTALFFVIVAYAMAERGGWLKPFKQGLFHTFSLKVRVRTSASVNVNIPLLYVI